ncbi:hypothetical protein [Nocardioides flavescens]|uniref:Uncharacterized protein n=1 Tax=Nocardioides flavescens TaxID=2691959 RepID=A0A6L7EZ39_9ACTN|nr:hypothetical protein [Nocardioides flavescens]MXG89735.1 hypothetical protein [Nocardioides flavescens]
MRRGLLMLPLLLLPVAGCDDDSDRASLSPQPTATTTAVDVVTPSAVPSGVPSVVPAQMSHPQLYARARRTLRAVRAVALGEYEPSHGGAVQSVAARWKGLDVQAYVVQTRLAPPVEAARTYEVRGRPVSVVPAGPDAVHRLEIGRDTWSVVVPGDPAATRVLVWQLVERGGPRAHETLQELVARADNLYGVRLTRDGDGYDVTAVWGVSCDHDECLPAIAVSRHAGGEARYESGDADELRARVAATGDGSLRPGTTVSVDGADGATVPPFRRVARDGEAPQDVVEPARAQVSGAVVLADGRLLTALTVRGRGGLWVSDGDDWTRSAPSEATFSPPLSQRRGAYGDVVRLEADADQQLVWLTTWEQRVYVSADDGETFEEVDVR